MPLMDLFQVTFQSVAVLLGVGLIGFWIIRRHLIPDYALGLLSPLALEIALPCLIFVNILTTFNPERHPDWWIYPIWWGVFTIFAAGLTFLCMFASQKKSRREFAISLFFQNGLFFPLAILPGMFPDEPVYLVYLFLFMLFFPTLLFNTYALFFKNQKQELNYKKIFHPVFVVTLFALAVRILAVHTYIPDLIYSVAALVGAMSLPLIMIILGGNIYLDFRKKEKFHTREIVKFVLIKNIFFPLVFIGFLLVVRPAYPIALIILLQSAVPPVTAVPILVGRAGGDQTITNQFIFASFLASLFSIPLMISIFGQVYS
ncbi:MAG: AEC family transporter [Candidatus Thermoplasmatota archaeon]